jgi:hypothetical protein
LVYSSTLKTEAIFSLETSDSSEQHVVTTQKTIHFILTALRVSDPTPEYLGEIEFILGLAQMI